MEVYKSLTDEEVVNGLKIRNPDAFRALYYNRTSALKSFVINNSGTASDAEEVEQKTIIILFEKIRDGSFRLNKGVQLSTFLFAVAKNVWYKELKAQSKLVTYDIVNETDHIVDPIEFEIHTDPKSKEEELLLKCLKQLNDTCQQILKGKYYLKLSDQEISDSLPDVSLDNVRKRKYKCIQKLKQLFSSIN